MVGCCSVGGAGCCDDDGSDNGQDKKTGMEMGSQLHRSTIHQLPLPYLSSKCALLASGKVARYAISSSNENNSSEDNIYKVYEINHHEGR